MTVVATDTSAQQEAEAGSDAALSSEALVPGWQTGAWIEGLIEVDIPLPLKPQRHAQLCVSSMISGPTELAVRLAITSWER